MIRWILLACFLCLAPCCNPIFAQSQSLGDVEKFSLGAGPDEYSFHKGPWEVGISWGSLIPLKKKTFSHSINNTQAYDLLQNEATGDEIAEGFIPPPLPGWTNITTSLRTIPELGIYFFYQWKPWLAVGLSGAKALRSEAHIDDPGIYDSAHFLNVQAQATLHHINVPFKYGEWHGRFKPQLIFGPGAYISQEKLRIAFSDDDDPQLSPSYVIWHDAVYLGAQLGAGLDIQVMERGILGLSVEYHKVFAPMGKLDFILPKLRMGVAF